jgi:hypothetical protein
MWVTSMEATAAVQVGHDARFDLDAAGHGMKWTGSLFIEEPKLGTLMTWIWEGI